LKTLASRGLVAAAIWLGLQIFWHFALETDLAALYYYE
jgi:hypothetical protein